MNKRKSSNKTISHFEVAFLLLAALVVIGAGVNYAILKNEQVSLDRKTESVRQDMMRHDLETQDAQVQVDRRYNRFAVKSELREMGSVMRERPDFVVERVNPVDRPMVHLEDLKVEFPNMLLEVNVYPPNAQVVN